MVGKIPRRFGDDLNSLIALIAVLAVVYPVAYRLSPTVGIAFGYAATWAIAALGFNLLFGYTGLLSFGHALFLGLGAYAAGFVYKYTGVKSLEVWLLAGIAASLAVAALIGPVVVRYTRIFFAILMLAIAQVFWSLYYKFYWITGGTDGIKVPRASVLGFSLEGLDFATYHHVYYYLVLSLLAVLAYVMWRIVNSPFGLALRAVRDNEERARFIGISVYKMRLYAFLLSAVYASITGAITAMHSRLVTPDIAYWLTSGKLVFLTLLGGTRVFIGPIIGSYAYHLIESVAMKFVYWQLVMGLLIAVIVIALPGGIMQLVTKAVEVFSSRYRPRVERVVEEEARRG